METLLQTLTPEMIWGGILIFFLRTLDMCMDTLRVLFVVRGKKVIVWILGVVQSCIYIVAISNVLSGDKNPYIILCYACGFATGNIFGMIIEEKLGIGFRELTIISKTHGTAIAAALRGKGFGATELTGHGMDGDVAIINTRIKRRQVAEAKNLVAEIDPKSVVTIGDFTPLNAGYWRK